MTGVSSLAGVPSLRCSVADLEGNGVPGHFELWSSGLGADGWAVNADSRSMGDDAVLSSSQSLAAVWGVNVDLKSIGDAVLSS